MPLIHVAKCGNCGQRLVVKYSLDADRDLTVEVEPCEGCIKDAVDDARAADRKRDGGSGAEGAAD